MPPMRNASLRTITTDSYQQKRWAQPSELTRLHCTSSPESLWRPSTVTLARSAEKFDSHPRGSMVLHVPRIREEALMAILIRVIGNFKQTRAGFLGRLSGDDTPLTAELSAGPTAAPPEKAKSAWLNRL
jgi:hypothetical protein